MKQTSGQAGLKGYEMEGQSDHMSLDEGVGGVDRHKHQQGISGSGNLHFPSGERGERGEGGEREIEQRDLESERNPGKEREGDRGRGRGHHHDPEKDPHHHPPSPPPKTHSQAHTNRNPSDRSGQRTHPDALAASQNAYGSAYPNEQSQEPQKQYHDGVTENSPKIHDQAAHGKEYSGKLQQQPQQQKEEPQVETSSGGFIKNAWSAVRSTADIPGLHAEIIHIRQQLARVRHERSEYRKERDHLVQLVRKERDAGRESAQIARDRYEDLRKVFDTERSENISIRKKLDKIAAQIDSKELFLGHQLSDNDLVSEWKSLTAQVRTWTVAFSAEHLVDKYNMRTLEEFVSAFSVLAAQSRDVVMAMVDKKSTRRELVQALVGHKLAEVVFRRMEDKSPPVLDMWAKDSTAKAIDHIERTLYQNHQLIKAREFNDWRAFTVSLLSRLDESASTPASTPSDALVAYIHTLLDLIYSWAKPKVDPEELYQGLVSIFMKATQFSCTVRKQRAYWTVKYLPTAGHNPTVFDPATMEDMDEDEDDEEEEEEERKGKQKVVKLFVFPGLYKRGNADGEHYNIESCVLRALVKCG